MSDDTEYGIVAARDLFCHACAHYVPPIGLQIKQVKRTKDGFQVVGGLRDAECPSCGMALARIAEVVPIEVDSLICECGSKEFSFTVETVKAKTAKDAGSWDFELTVNCKKCSRKRLVQRILDFFRLKRVKVSLTGVTVEMK